MLETLKPGETLESRDHRFQNWSQRTGYNDKYHGNSPVFSNERFQTDFKQNITDESAKLKDIFGLSTSLRDKNKSQVSKKTLAMSSQRILGASVQMDTFAPHRSRSQQLITPPEVFDEVLPFHVVTYQCQECILLSSVPAIVKQALGEDTPIYIIDRYAKLASRRTVDRYLTVDHWR